MWELGYYFLGQVLLFSLENVQSSGWVESVYEDFGFINYMLFKVRKVAEFRTLGFEFRIYKLQVFEVLKVVEFRTLGFGFWVFMQITTCATLRRSD